MVSQRGRPICTCPTGFEGQNCQTLSSSAQSSSDKGLPWPIIGGAAGGGLLLLLLLLLLLRRKKSSSTELEKPKYVDPFDDPWEIPRSKIIITHFLGNGAFGEVHRGCIEVCSWRVVAETLNVTKEHPGNPLSRTNVAIKSLKPQASTDEEIEFRSEIDLMKQLAQDQNMSKHIVRYVSYCHTPVTSLMHSA